MKLVTLFSETANGSSGIPRYVRSLAKGISEYKSNDIELKLAVRRLKKVPSLDDLNLKYTTNPLQGKLQDYIRKFKNGEQLLYGKTDIVHEPNYNLLSFSNKTKKILTVHDVGWRLSEVSYGLTENFIRDAEKSIKIADQIITPTQSVKNDVIKFYSINPDKITVIPHGVELVFHSDKTIQLTKQLPSEYWLFVGALTARKNLERGIEALSHMSYKIPLVIVGPRSEYAEMLSKDAEKKGVKVILVNDADDQELKEIYKCAKGLIYPSFWEGFGLPIIEAASTGTPIVTSNNTAMKEIGEGYAYLVDPLKTSDIVAALNEIINLDESQRGILRRHGKDLVKIYNWKKSVEAHLKLYKSL